MTPLRRRAFGAIFAALLPAGGAFGQTNTIDITIHDLDLRAKRLVVGDSEKTVEQKMSRMPASVEEAKCETPPQDCKIYEYRDSDDSVFVYFSRSEQKSHPWVLLGYYKQGFWKPLSPSDVMKQSRGNQQQPHRRPDF